MVMGDPTVITLTIDEDNFSESMKRQIFHEGCVLLIVELSILHYINNLRSTECSYLQRPWRVFNSYLQRSSFISGYLRLMCVVGN